MHRLIGPKKARVPPRPSELVPHNHRMLRPSRAQAGSPALSDGLTAVKLWLLTPENHEGHL